MEGKVKTMDANIDLVGTIILLRRLVKRGVIGIIEAEKIARRIAAHTGANIVVAL